MSEKRNKLKFLNIKTAGVVLTVGIVFLALKQLSFVRESPQIIYNMVQLMIKLPIAVGLMLLVWKVSSKINMYCFQWLGMISYELYLLHGYFLQIVSKNMVGSILFIVLSVGFAICFWYLLEKSKPWQRRLLLMN